MNSLNIEKKREKLEIFIKESLFAEQLFKDTKPEAYYAMDVEGKFVIVNRACELISGYSQEELNQFYYSDLIIEYHLQNVQTKFHYSLTGTIQQYQCTILSKSNERVDLEVTNSPIIVDNEIIGVYGIAKNITYFNEQRRKLKESERLHRSLIEHAPDGVIITQEQRVVFANKKASELLGGNKVEDILGKDVSIFLKRYSSMLINNFSMAEKGLASELHEVKIVQLNNKEIDVEIKTIPTIFQEDHAVYFIIRDITERKLAHEMMINSEKLTVAGQLAAGIAHEIRNPITAIKGFLQLMESGKNYKQEFFSVISAEINRMEIILSELLALAKPQLERYRHRDIQSILKHVVTLTKTQAILHNVNLKTTFHPEPIFVLCDENKLKQVFINFIKNAIEAMKNEGTITLIVEKYDDSSVVVNIKDQGSGIPKKILDRIGEPFFTTKENGTGLGVMVSLEIMKHHNGAVTIESDSNGTTVSIQLPISKPED
ncbi:hypothetical protein CJ195_02215 [Bacillus sp. UMB0899]|nr:hypothetical protein CJ195_02215 [Bacillus sp. UMB0899]